MWQLVFYRVIQGFGGGALQPTAQAILFESYPPEKRAGAMAIFGLGAMVGPALGPTLGGVIVDNYSWPLIFYINIPIGIVAFVMTLLYIRDPSYLKRDKSPVDVLGLGLLTAGVASVQYVLERGQREDWFSSSTIVILTAVAVVSLAVFCWREWHDPRPLVDLKVFKSRAFSAGNVIGIITGFGLFGTALVLPLFLQNVLGFTATETGFVLLPGAIATAISMPIASRLTHRVDGRAMIAFGLLVFAASAWWMGGINQSSGYWDVFWPRALQGFALGFLFVPLSTATLGEIARAKMANATGIYTLVRQLGGSLGIAILQFLQVRDADNAYASLASGRHAREPQRQPVPARPARQRGAALPDGDAQRDRDLVRHGAAAVRDRLRAVDPAGDAAELAQNCRGRPRGCRGGGIAQEPARRAAESAACALSPPRSPPSR